MTLSASERWHEANPVQKDATRDKLQVTDIACFIPSRERHMFPVWKLALHRRMRNTLFRDHVRTK